MDKSRIFLFALVAAALIGCEKKPASTVEVRPDRIIVSVERRAEGDVVSFTGQIRAKDEASVAFRIDGRMVDRPVSVGDVVKPGQFIARLDPNGEQDSLRKAQGNLVSAEATLTEALLNFPRKQRLVQDVPEQTIRSGPRDPVVHLALTNDPSVTAIGRVREVSPQTDATTRSFEPAEKLG